MHFELTRMLHPFRRMLLELGRRWTESGLVDAPDDVFFLTLDELSPAGGGAAGGAGPDPPAPRRL